MTEAVGISQARARGIWMRAQRLDERAPFGAGPDATRRAVEHLGYVQIDTINVIERCHHHILFSRIPDYQRVHLSQAQSVDKSVFEYWTHALSYVPRRDYRFYMRKMKEQRTKAVRWFGDVTPSEVRKVVTRVRREGALSIRDIDTDVRIEKTHEWASRKPSKKALEFAFFTGDLTVSARTGMVKTYELSERHFGWERREAAATEGEITDYMLDRALRAQGVVSLDSICHLDAGRKGAVLKRVEARVRRGELVAVVIEGCERVQHWAEPRALDEMADVDGGLVHILSPFDPLIIQRKRLKLLFDYEHRFEAYVPGPKRVFGYFALPVLVGDEVVAAIDLKTDRQRGELLIQKWSWVGCGRARAHKRVVEEELGRFEKWQLGA
ncbi:MAG: crosslink repair DNA glycosylase YcaQ family protein [Hyphomicrobiaceae bacterium]